MNRIFRAIPLAGAASLLCATGTARALDLNAGDWKFSVDGNVNVHYIYSDCESAASAKLITTVGGACTGSASSSSVSNVGNGLLPAAITFGVATTQAGYDIAGHFGFYPGIDTNDGGSPNVQQGAPAGSNVALGTTGLDVRQVYMTFGNKDIGSFLLGRNFGLFGFDAIINDMTIPGVGVGGSMSGAAPANTSLGSIGFGYIYTDTLAQMDYTTPDFAGFAATLGIYDPLNSLTAPGSSEPKTTPGFHGKLTYTLPLGGADKLYLSSAFIDQKQKYLIGATDYSYNAFGIDAFAKLDIAAFEGIAYYYHGSGLGTTGYFLNSNDAAGEKRSSNGYLVQATYKLGKLKLGVNYGDSMLGLAHGEAASALVQSNRKVTGGAYYSLTKNLTLLGEVTDVRSKSHLDESNTSLNFNVGAYLSF